MDAPAETSAVAALIGGTVGERRAIVWRRALQVAIDETSAAGAPAAEVRARVLELLRTALENGRAEVRRRQIPPDGYGGFKLAMDEAKEWADTSFRVTKGGKS